MASIDIELSTFLRNEANRYANLDVFINSILPVEKSTKFDEYKHALKGGLSMLITALVDVKKEKVYALENIYRIVGNEFVGSVQTLWTNHSIPIVSDHTKFVLTYVGHLFYIIVCKNWTSLESLEKYAKIGNRIDIVDLLNKKRINHFSAIGSSDKEIRYETLTRGIIFFPSVDSKQWFMTVIKRVYRPKSGVIQWYDPISESYAETKAVQNFLATDAFTKYASEGVWACTKSKDISKVPTIRESESTEFTEKNTITLLDPRTVYDLDIDTGLSRNIFVSERITTNFKTLISFQNMIPVLYNEGYTRALYTNENNTNAYNLLFVEIRKISTDWDIDDSATKFITTSFMDVFSAFKAQSYVQSDNILFVKRESNLVAISNRIVDDLCTKSTINGIFTKYNSTKEEYRSANVSLLYRRFKNDEESVSFESKGPFEQIEPVETVPLQTKTVATSPYDELIETPIGSPIAEQVEIDLEDKTPITQTPPSPRTPQRDDFLEFPIDESKSTINEASTTDIIQTPPSPRSTQTNDLFAFPTDENESAINEASTTTNTTTIFITTTTTTTTTTTITTSSTISTIVSNPDTTSQVTENEVFSANAFDDEESGKEEKEEEEEEESTALVSGFYRENEEDTDKKLAYFTIMYKDDDKFQKILRRKLEQRQTDDIRTNEFYREHVRETVELLTRNTRWGNPVPFLEPETVAQNIEYSGILSFWEYKHAWFRYELAIRYLSEAQLQNYTNLANSYLRYNCYRHKISILYNRSVDCIKSYEESFLDLLSTRDISENMKRIIFNNSDFKDQWVIYLEEKETERYYLLQLQTLINLSVDCVVEMTQKYEDPIIYEKVRARTLSSSIIFSISEFSSTALAFLDKLNELIEERRLYANTDKTLTSFPLQEMTVIYSIAAGELEQIEEKINILDIEIQDDNLKWITSKIKNIQYDEESTRFKKRIEKNTKMRMDLLKRQYNLKETIRQLRGLYNKFYAFTVNRKRNLNTKGELLISVRSALEKAKEVVSWNSFETISQNFVVEEETIRTIHNIINEILKNTERVLSIKSSGNIRFVSKGAVNILIEYIKNFKNTISEAFSKDNKLSFSRTELILYLDLFFTKRDDQIYTGSLSPNNLLIHLEQENYAILELIRPLEKLSGMYSKSLVPTQSVTEILREAEKENIYVAGTESAENKLEQVLSTKSKAENELEIEEDKVDEETEEYLEEKEAAVNQTSKTPDIVEKAKKDDLDVIRNETDSVQLLSSMKERLYSIEEALDFKVLLSLGGFNAYIKKGIATLKKNIEQVSTNKEVKKIRKIFLEDVSKWDALINFLEVYKNFTQLPILKKCKQQEKDRKKLIKLVDKLKFTDSGNRPPAIRYIQGKIDKMKSITKDVESCTTSITVHKTTDNDIKNAAQDLITKDKKEVNDSALISKAQTKSIQDSDNLAIESNISKEQKDSRTNTIKEKRILSTRQNVRTASQVYENSESIFMNALTNLNNLLAEFSSSNTEFDVQVGTGISGEGLNITIQKGINRLINVLDVVLEKIKELKANLKTIDTTIGEEADFEKSKQLSSLQNKDNYVIIEQLASYIEGATKSVGGIITTYNLFKKVPQFKSLENSESATVKEILNENVVNWFSEQDDIRFAILLHVLATTHSNFLEDLQFRMEAAVIEDKTMTQLTENKEQGQLKQVLYKIRTEVLLVQELLSAITKFGGEGLTSNAYKRLIVLKNTDVDKPLDSTDLNTAQKKLEKIISVKKKLETTQSIVRMINEIVQFTRENEPTIPEVKRTESFSQLQKDFALVIQNFKDINIDDNLAEVLQMQRMNIQIAIRTAFRLRLFCYGPPQKKGLIGKLFVDYLLKPVRGIFAKTQTEFEKEVNKYSVDDNIEKDLTIPSDIQQVINNQNSKEEKKIHDEIKILETTSTRETEDIFETTNIEPENPEIIPTNVPTEDDENNDKLLFTWNTTTKPEIEKLKTTLLDSVRDLQLEKPTGLVYDVYVLIGLTILPVENPKSSTKEKAYFIVKEVQPRLGKIRETVERLKNISQKVTLISYGLKQNALKYERLKVHFDTIMKTFTSHSNLVEFPLELVTDLEKFVDYVFKDFMNIQNGTETGISSKIPAKYSGSLPSPFVFKVQKPQISESEKGKSTEAQLYASEVEPYTKPSAQEVVNEPAFSIFAEFQRKYADALKPQDELNQQEIANFQKKEEELRLRQIAEEKSRKKIVAEQEKLKQIDANNRIKAGQVFSKTYSEFVTNIPARKKSEFKSVHIRTELQTRYKEIFKGTKRNVVRARDKLDLKNRAAYNNLTINVEASPATNKKTGASFVVMLVSKDNQDNFYYYEFNNEEIPDSYLMTRESGDDVFKLSVVTKLERNYNTNSYGESFRNKDEILVVLSSISKVPINKIKLASYILKGKSLPLDNYDLSNFILYVVYVQGSDLDVDNINWDDYNTDDKEKIFKEYVEAKTSGNDINAFSYDKATVYKKTDPKKSIKFPFKFPIGESNRHKFPSMKNRISIIQYTDGTYDTKSMKTDFVDLETVITSAENIATRDIRDDNLESGIFPFPEILVSEAFSDFPFFKNSSSAVVENIIPFAIRFDTKDDSIVLESGLLLRID